LWFRNTKYILWALGYTYPMVWGKRNIQLISASKYQWVKWKLKNATCLKFLYIKDGVLLFRYRRNDWSQFVSTWLQSSLVQEILFLTVSHLSWPSKLTLDTGRHIKCCFRHYLTFFWHYLIAKAFGIGNWASGLYLVSGIKSTIVASKDYGLQECIYSHDDVVLQCC